MMRTGFWIYLAAFTVTTGLFSTSYAQVTMLSEFNRCSWNIGLTLASSPNSVQRAYFNEKGPFDIKDLLKEPDVQSYVSMVTIGDGTGHFTHPYFILVRGVCDTGYYDDNYYRVIMYGAYPVLTLEYAPETMRDEHRGSVRVSTTGVLVDLVPDPKAGVPINQAAPNCYFNLCYPGFLIPQIFLNIPIFDVTVAAMDEFKQYTKRIYVSPYNSRKSSSKVEISSDMEDPASWEFFPPQRIGTTDDPENLRSSIMMELEDAEHFPLDKEDFIEPQYTLGSSPTVFLAGFYDPNLLIMMDPDLNDIRRLRWNLNPLNENKSDERSTVFDHGLTCTLDKSYEERNGSYPVPLFTRGEGPNAYSWLGTFYRKRFKPLQYLNSPIPMAIFDIISLEERLLLVTNSGLVTFYGETNSTVGTGRAFRAADSEKIRKCFKFVRTCKFANQQADVVVGVTYHYNEVKTTNMRPPNATTMDISSTVQTINQEIWVGRLEERGTPMKWERLGESQGLELPEDEVPSSQAMTICEQAIAEKFFDIQHSIELSECWIQDATPSPASGSIQVLVEMQLQHMPTLLHISQATKDGNETVMNLVPGEELVTFYIIAEHSPSKAYRKSLWAIVSIVPRRPCINPYRQAVENIENYETAMYFHNPHRVKADPDIKNDDIKGTEEPNSVDPNRNDGDTEEEPNKVDTNRNNEEGEVEQNNDYTNKNADEEEEEEPDGAERFEDSCHLANRDKAKDDLYLYRMTYTRQPTGHLFLYGNRLIHSTDGGDAFAFMRSFPSEYEVEEISHKNKDFVKATDESARQKYYAELNKMIVRHVIKLMAFSSTGNYAFLTSKRHLYWGSVGSLYQIRLRPSPGYSVIRTMLSHKPGLHDGRPFAIFFDSFNNLHEMIATVNSNSTVVSITKRTIPWSMIIKNNNFVKKMFREADKLRRSTQSNTEDNKIPSTFRGRNIEDTENNDNNDSYASYEDYQNHPNNDNDRNDTQNSEEAKDNVFSHGIARFKDFCPYGDITIDQNYTAQFDRFQHFSVIPPKQHSSLGIVSGNTLLMAFQAIMFSLIHSTHYHPKQNDYSHLGEDDPFVGWRKETAVQSRLATFKYTVGDPKSHGIIFDSAGAKSISTSAAENKRNKWLRRFYLDYNYKIQIVLSFSVKTRASIDKTNYRTQRLSALQITVDNSNGSLLEVETERILSAKDAGVQFKILLALNKKVGTQPGASLPQQNPGKFALIIPISFHFLNGFEYCAPTSDGSYIGDSVHTSVYAGCIPNRVLKLNWNETLRSQRFRDPKAWMGVRGDCYDNEPACFYSQIFMVMHFDLYDTVLPEYIKYQGKYTLRVIGGGYTRSSIVDYTEEEQKAYNTPGVSDVSLVWTEWNIKDNRKVDVQPADPDIEHLVDARETILVAGKSAIKWTCNIFSPCSRVTPTWSLQTFFYFKIRISNRDVDQDTLCLHEQDIVIQLYGFSPSSEIQLLISVIACILILFLIYLIYVCNRNEKRVWKANQVKIYGWLQIIVDTFPKPESVKDQKKELQLQLQKDEILLSLRGYLGVPSELKPSEDPMHSSKPSDPKKLPTDQVSTLSRALSKRLEQDKSSQEDDETDSEEGNQKPIAKVLPRRPPATWTDMVYNQLILKRATAIQEGQQKEQLAIDAQVLKNQDKKDPPEDKTKKT